MKSFYSANISDFSRTPIDSILGNLVKNNPFSLEDTQRNSWIEEINILKNILEKHQNGKILFEYAIPRMGKRVDVVLLINGYVFLIEFKIGQENYSSGYDQVLDYALDLKYFHKASYDIPIIPILCATKAENIEYKFEHFNDKVYSVVKTNKQTLGTILDNFLSTNPTSTNSLEYWEDSEYAPTPTIIEAAQALYSSHGIIEITRNDAGTQNISKTASAIDKIIAESKINKQKSICFITGVPGSGKTLAGLNIANSRHNFQEEEHAVFLSGNAPLVDVLQEALVRDELNKKTKTNKITRKDTERKVKAFIQIIHHFRDACLTNKTQPPIEKVAIFDEAQRAWNKAQTSYFMAKKKGIDDFDMSEPEFLVSAMDRHQDWAVIICLVGGGQEINVGEAGIREWFIALKEKYPHWNVYVSKNISDSEYGLGNEINSLFDNFKITNIPELHLNVSIRSFRSENLASVVKNILDNKINEAKIAYERIKDKYPILVTRDINKAKKWLRTKARGTERFGIVASSNSRRLKPYGLFSQLKIDAPDWFLNTKDDINSSYFLEDVATEFDVQGLELDWTCVAWDADMQYRNGAWVYKIFRGKNWQKLSDVTKIAYKRNAYRVLLTRARQGMIIFVPPGNDADKTHLSEFYNETFNFFREIGITEI